MQDVVPTWTVVQFVEDGTVEAIPSNWIQGDMCHWPPYFHQKLVMAIRKCEALNTCWPTHKIKSFRNSTFGNIEICSFYITYVIFTYFFR